MIKFFFSYIIFIYYISYIFSICPRDCMVCYPGSNYCFVCKGFIEYVNGYCNFIRLDIDFCSEGCEWCDSNSFCMYCQPGYSYIIDENGLLCTKLKKIDRYEYNEESDLFFYCKNYWYINQSKNYCCNNCPSDKRYYIKDTKQCVSNCGDYGLTLVGDHCERSVRMNNELNYYNESGKFIEEQKKLNNEENKENEKNSNKSEKLKEKYNNNNNKINEKENKEQINKETKEEINKKDENNESKNNEIKINNSSFSYLSKKDEIFLNNINEDNKCIYNIIYENINLNENWLYNNENNYVLSIINKYYSFLESNNNNNILQINGYNFNIIIFKNTFCYSNIFSLKSDFNDCLKNISSIYTINFENYNNLYYININYNNIKFFQFYLNDKKILITNKNNICNSIKIFYQSNIENNFLNMFNNMLNKKINILDKNDNFYNEICFPFYGNINNRYFKYYKKLTLCDNNCKLNQINNNKEIECICNLNLDKNFDVSNQIEKEYKFYYLFFGNFNIFKCYNMFELKYYKKNWVSFVLLSLNLIVIILTILYFKGNKKIYFKIKEELKKIHDNYNKNNEVYIFSNKEEINNQINKMKYEMNSPSKNNIISSEEKENTQSKNSYYLTSNKSFINKTNSNSKSKNIIKKNIYDLALNTSNKISKNYNVQSYIYSNKKTKNNDDINNYIYEYSNIKFYKYICNYLIENIYFLNLIFVHNKYESIFIKLIIFICEFKSYFLWNSIFFRESYLSYIIFNKKKYSIYYIIQNELIRLFIFSLVNYFFKIIEKNLYNLNKQINLLLDQLNKEYNKTIYYILNHKLKYLKKLNIIMIILFYFLIIIYFYYISIFSVIYKNYLMNWVEGTFITIFILILIKIILLILYTILDNKEIYEIEYFKKFNEFL